MPVKAPSAAQRAQTTKFFDAVFAGVPEDMQTYLWTLQDKRSHWFPTSDIAALATAAVDIATTPASGAPEGSARDTYLAVSAAAELPLIPSKRQHTRITSANSGGIYGLWADVDFTDPDAHKAFNLPANQEEAQELVDSMGLEPSLVVHSGHGLQVWWLFHEFWRFDTDDDRRQAADLAGRWIATMRARAAERKQIVDPVYDLARVMRIPGTYNLKGDPRPVKLLRDTGARYSSDDFEAHILDDAYLAQQGVSSARTYVVGQLELTESATPAFARFQALMENFDEFEKTWERKRRDLTDQSPSTYDMSLASQAAAAGWEDQEIANLLIAFRQKHRLDVAKALRIDYVTRTIAKARDGRSRTDATERIEDVTAALDAAVESQDQSQVDHARRGVLDVISEQLGIEVTRVSRYTSEPPTFRLVTPTHAIDLGPADGILRLDRFRTSVYAAAGHLVPRMKAPQWDAVAELFPKAWVEEDLGFEATARGEVHGWLTDYFADKPPVADLDEAVESEMPFVRDGRTYLWGPALARYLWLRHKESVNRKELGKKLRDFGAVPENQSVYVTGDSGDRRRTTKQAWLLPTSWRG